MSASPASAQSLLGASPVLEALWQRENLIVAQENQLNFYRCYFGVDVSAVAGGCTNGVPTERSLESRALVGMPTVADLQVRDRLIARQEALLNVYRCRYGRDLQAVQGGCGQQLSSESSPAQTTGNLLSPSQAIATGGLPKGIITPTGVTVAVVGTDGDAYRVRSPCGTSATVSKGQPLRDVRVVIDPGHGGPHDTGASGINGLLEKHLNLILSRAVLTELASRGIGATTTRTGEYDSLLWVRSSLADVLEAEALVSLHHNAPTFRIGSEPGTEVFVQSESQQFPRADSARLGGLLYAEITEALSRFKNVRWSQLSDAGVLRVLVSSGRDAYGMLRYPEVPAVLVEYGYLSNPSEAALFATDEYITVAAKATANAVEAFLNTQRTGISVNLQPRVFVPGRAPSACDEVPLE